MCDTSSGQFARARSTRAPLKGKIPTQHRASAHFRVHLLLLLLLIDGLRERLKPPTSRDLESARLKAAETPALALTMSSIKSATGCTEPALPHTTASKASPCLRPSGRSFRKPMEMRWS